MNRIMLLCILACVGGCGTSATMKSIQLITLDPGHFHAGLVQKDMYPQVSPVVHVYAPAGDDLQEHLKRVDSFNTRKENPTHWQEVVYTNPDFFQKMVQDRAGNVVVLSGNNAKKAKYILDSVQAGFNVLADKPMAITPGDFDLLKQAFAEAKKKDVLLYDIMTERYEITTMLQRALSQQPQLFGELVKGTLEEPAVTKESVHHFCKMVSGVPLKRPAWFFDVTQQGEGIVDVTTHLVDLIQWECFPEATLDYTKDVQIQSARRWATTLSPEQFKKVTGREAQNPLEVYSNGEINYTLKGVHAKVSVTWNFEAPPGTGDTHYSIMRGTGCNLVIRQGKEQNYKPTLYVESNNPVETNLNEALVKLNGTWPGLLTRKVPGGWQIVIPERYAIGHEGHFAQVTQKYLKFLEEGKIPEWEVPNMLTKYYTTTKAYEMSRP